jgi:HK97 family phage major capsid protein
MENSEVRMFRQYFKIDEVRQKDRTIIATLSTENPVERIEGNEVLVHEPGAIDLSRAPLPLITSHESHTQTPIGRVDNLRIVNRQLKGDLVFGKGRRASSLWQDVQDGIARHLSVGYIPLKKTKPDSTGTYYVTKWQPMETSIVSTPADIDAVIGRSATNQEGRMIEKMKTFFGKDKKRNYDRVDEYFARQPHPTEFLRHLVNAPIADGKVYGHIHPSLRATGLSEGSGSGGGFLAPQGWTDRILYHKWGSKIFPMCNTFKVEYNSMQIPQLDDSDRSSGLFLNAPTYQVEEAGEKIISKLRLMTNQASMKKTCCIIAATDEIINDANALEQWVFDSMGKSIGWDLDRQIIRGDHTDSILGLLNSPAKIRIPKAAGQTANTIVLANVVNQISRLTPEALTSKSTVFLVNPDALPQLYTMSLTVGAAGSSAIPAYRFKGPGEDFDTLFGYKVIPTEHASVVGDEGDCILASLDRFLIATRSLKKATSSSWGFLTDQTAFRCVLRSWGQLDHAKTITPYNGGSNLSSVITIADRA